MDLNWKNKKTIMGIVALWIILYISLQNIHLIGDCIANIFSILKPFFVIFIILLQQIETNLIYPRVVGESTNSICNLYFA